MKVLIKFCFLLLLLSSQSWAGPIAAHRGSQGGCYGQGGSAGASCTSTYAEQVDSENAVAPAGVSEADATTDWTDGTGGGFDSIDTAPQSGTYHFTATATANEEHIRVNLNSIYGIAGGTFIKLSYYVRHVDDGAGDWVCFLGSSSTAPAGAWLGANIITNANLVYSNSTLYAILNTGNSVMIDSDTFVCRENSGTNNGSIYLDNFSVTVPTLCEVTGTELYTSADAMKVTSDADSIGGWTGFAATPDTLDSENVGEGQAPKDGTYHIHIADTGTANAGAYLDLSTYMTAGKKYKISLWARNDGAGGDWKLGLSDVATLDTTLNLYLGALAVTDTTYLELATVITYGAAYRYLQAHEYSATNNGGIYIDKLSIKEITE